MVSKISFIQDYQGNSLPVKNYRRIVSLVPSLTDLLFSFGLENAIVGVTKYCVSPPQAMQKPRTIVGGTKNPNIKTILELKPDIVLINQEENQLKHFKALQENDIPVFITFPKTVDEAVSLFYDLQKLFQISKSEQFEELKIILSKIKEKTLTLQKKKKVFCLIWKKPWISINEDTFASSMIEYCGGQNLTSNYLERYPKIDLGTIIDLNPDVILLPDEPYKFQEEDKKELKDFFKETSLKIEIIDGTFHWYSFKMIQSISNLSRILLYS